jgi:hypothetical protein
MCVPGTVRDGHVEIRTLGTLMDASVMPNLSDFGNCGHIVIMATSGQIDGANRC